MELEQGPHPSFSDFSSSLHIPCYFSSLRFQVVWVFDKSVLSISLRVISRFLNFYILPLPLLLLQFLLHTPDHANPLAPRTSQMHLCPSSIVLVFALFMMPFPHTSTLLTPPFLQVSALVSPYFSGMWRSLAAALSGKSVSGSRAQTSGRVSVVDSRLGQCWLRGWRWSHL